MWTIFLLQCFITLAASQNTTAKRGRPLDSLYVVSRPFGQIKGTQTQNFIELLKSDFYLDKTLILKEILKQRNHKTVLITLPAKWGKSLNLNMMKTFLEIEVDAYGNEITPKKKSINYRLFRKNEIIMENETIHLDQPLRISFCKSFLKWYQGRHAVIFLDFGNIKGYTFKEILREIRYRIKNAFAEHKYMIEALKNQTRSIELTSQKNHTEEKLNGFMKMMYEKLNHDDLAISLELLSKILYQHFGTKVFILVDNYEDVLLHALSNTAVSETEASLILAFFSTFIGSSFQRNIYLEKSIFTGSFKMLNLIPQLTDVKHYVGTQHILMRLCSVDHEVLMSIFDRLNIRSSIRKKAINWYGGYHWGKQFCYSIYSPQTVMNFLSTGKIDYLKKRHPVFDPLFENSLQYRNIRTYILWFLSSRSIPVYKDTIKPEQFLINFIKFKEALQNSENPFDVQAIEPYLCGVGILALVKLNYWDVDVRIPNNAVRMEVAEKLMHFYEKNFNISIPALNGAVTNLVSFLSNKNTNLQNMTSSLQTITKNEPLMKELAGSKVKEEEIFELFFCFVLNYITFQITLSYDYQIESIEEVQRDKWILFNGHTATFIQFKLNASSAEHVLNISKNHATTMPKFAEKKFINFVGINFQPNGDVHICTQSQRGPLSTHHTSEPS